MSQVSPDPEIPFPHAAMVTPQPASTPWLQPLTTSLSSLGPIASNRVAKKEKKKKKDKKKRPDTSGTGMAATTVVSAIDVAPRFVTPVWESCVKILDRQSGCAIDESGNRRHLHLADAQLFASGEDGDAERPLVVLPQASNEHAFITC